MVALPGAMFVLWLCSVVAVAPCSLGVGGPTDIVLIVSFNVRVSLKLVYFVDLICCQAMVLDRSQDVPVAFIRLMISMLLETACDTNIFLFYNYAI